MNLSIRAKLLVLVGVATACSLFGYAALIRSAERTGAELRQETDRRIAALIGQNTAQADALLRLMERNAVDLANAGETFRALRQRAAAGDPAADLQQYLVSNFAGMPEAIGGGLWYEPGAFEPQRTWFGPYAFRRGDTVAFTWELSTPAYDYHTRDWYLTALPRDWDRSVPRPQRVYWTAPYFDDAGTRSLMITVDALMYDRQRIIGMATLDFSLDDLQLMAGRMRVTPGATVFAIDRATRLLLAHTADRAALLTPVAQQPWGAAVAAVPAGDTVTVRRVPLNGEPHTLFIRPAGSMLLGIVCPDRELYAAIGQLSRDNTVTFIMVISCQVLLCLLLACVMIRQISNPVSALTAIAQQIADSDLAGALRRLQAGTAGQRRDETGRLHAAFSRMTANLHALLRQVRQLGTAVAGAGAQITAAAGQLEDSVNRQAVSAAQVSASSREISRTAGDLASTMSGVTDAAAATARLATAGREGLAEMSVSMQDVRQAAGVVAGRLADIRTTAGAIDGIIATVARVADQTNLLSLNAAIEAEKAGEYGRGFAVVAREIRRLADQTAVAVLDIEQMLHRMETAVGSGVGEMEKFDRILQGGTETVSGLGHRFEGILDQVLQLTARFDAVNRAMSGQSAGATQISEAMDELKAVTQATSASAGELLAVAAQLEGEARELQQALASFTTD